MNAYVHALMRFINALNAQRDPAAGAGGGAAGDRRRAGKGKDIQEPLSMNDLALEAYCLRPCGPTCIRWDVWGGGGN